MHRKFTLLLLFVVAALLRVGGSRDQEATGTGGDDSDRTTYVEYNSRAEANEAVCDRTDARFLKDAVADYQAGTGIFNIEGQFVVHRKPVISK